MLFNDDDEISFLANEIEFKPFKDILTQAFNVMVDIDPTEIDMGQGQEFFEENAILASLWAVGRKTDLIDKLFISKNINQNGNFLI